MQVKVIKKEKEELEIELDSLTLAELLRRYLWEDPATKLVVWRREHPSKNPILYVKTKGKTAKKAIDDGVKAVIKDLDKVAGDFKKLK